MPDKELPQEIYILSLGQYEEDADDGDLGWRRDWKPSRLPNLDSVNIGSLQGQVNVFLQQMDQMMTETPDKVGKFRLDEFEVAVGFVVEAKGSVKLALLANTEAGGSINASMKFVFKRG